jgi:peptidoglycan lytic transglycosylase
MRSIGSVDQSGCKPRIAGGRDERGYFPSFVVVRVCSAFMRTAAPALLAASLAACAQTSVVSQRGGVSAPVRHAALEPRHQLHSPHAPVSVVRRHEPERDEPVRHASAAAIGGAHGVASFYSDPQATASGERFDPNELTAAHRTLPFGTRLQVTNVATGKSVTVRVNDRGPFVKGRVVDVSYSAAEALGMVHSGVADVKVNVLQ